METIKSYIENCFSSLPQNEKVANAKAALLAAMEDKYNDLRSRGKAENEAIGTVISEFGDMSELKRELGLEGQQTASGQDEEHESDYVLDLDNAMEYYSETKRFGRALAFGIFLCINSVSALLLINQLDLATLRFPDVTGVCALLVIIAIAVAIFIFSSLRYEKYDEYEDGIILLRDDAKEWVNGLHQSSKNSFAAGIVIGVMLCILSPIAFFVMPEAYIYLATPVLLFVIGIAVALFITVSMSYGCVDTLVKGVKSKSRKSIRYDKENRAMKTFNSILWPLTVIVFMIWGFIFDGWGICWIVFPISGLLVAVVSPILASVEESKAEKKNN